MAEQDRFVLELLDESTWPLLAEVAAHDGPCVLDLSGVKIITPSGAVGMVLMTRSRRRYLTIVILPPRKGKASAYLQLIDFLHLARVYGNVRFDRPVDYGRVTMKEISFTKLLISGSDDYVTAHDVIHRHFETVYPGNVRELKVVFSEVLNNIQDHASSEGNSPFFCVQVQTGRQGLQLTFGDLGVGFRTSLARNPELSPFSDEPAALEGAIVHGYSSCSHINPERGGGLKRALDHVVRLRGDYRVVSKDGVACMSAAHGMAFSTLSHPFPGAIVGISIPAR